MNKRVYIIEDDSNILSGLKAKFQIDNFEVETSPGNNILEVISRLKEFQAEYIVLDLILPNIDGFELLKTIKEDDALASLPVFIFTDSSDQDLRARSLRLGANFYFLKNEFNLDEFAEKAKNIIFNLEK